jgi:hypothetical protein
MTGQDDVVNEVSAQYADGAGLSRESGPLRVSLQILDASGEVVFDHRCQEFGLVHELKMRLWRRVRVQTEPLKCSFFAPDGPGSNLIWRCPRPLGEHVRLFQVTVPGGAVQVPVCEEHWKVLEEREKSYDS